MREREGGDFGGEPRLGADQVGVGRDWEKVLQNIEAWLPETKSDAQKEGFSKKQRKDAPSELGKLGFKPDEIASKRPEVVAILERVKNTPESARSGSEWKELQKRAETIIGEGINLGGLASVYDERRKGAAEGEQSAVATSAPDATPNPEPEVRAIERGSLVPVGESRVPTPARYLYPEDGEAAERVRAEQERLRAEMGGQPPEVVEGEFREIPNVRFYEGIRLDLETARGGYRNLGRDARNAVRQRLEEAGFQFDPQGRPIDEGGIESMTAEQIREMIRGQANVPEAEGEAAEPVPDVTPEPVVEADPLKELMKDQAQKLMEHLGAYSGGDYDGSDIDQLRVHLQLAGVNIVGMGDQQIREAALERLETARQLLRAVGTAEVNINALSREDLMREAQGAYFRLLVNQVNERLIEHRDSLSEASFDRRGYDSHRRKQALDNLRTQLGTALDRVITDMNFYDHGLLAHRTFQNNLREWLLDYGDENIEARLERYRNLTKDGGIRERFKTPDDWIRAIREQLVYLEKQTRGGNVDAWLEMKVKMEAPGTGYVQFVPIFEAMDDPGLVEVKRKMEAEVAARAGLDAAYKIWDSNRTDAGKLISAMVGRVGSEKEEAPSEKLKLFSLGWLESLSLAEGQLGKRIELALKKYIDIGERELQRYYRQQELAEQNLPVARRVDLEAWLLANPSLGTNIFSDKNMNDVAATYIRERIAADPMIGKEGEELAFRMMFLFGLAAKYDLDQSPAGFGCFYRDDLASMMRPNDCWQMRDRVLSSTPIGPYEIVGERDNFSNQPLRHIGFLVSYPDMVGYVLMKDGTIMPMMKALIEGKYTEIDWKEIPSKYDYNAFVRRMDKARQVETILLAMPPGDLKDVEVDAIAKLEVNVATALTEYRPVESQTEKEFVTSAGVRWMKREFKRREEFADEVTQGVLRNKMLAIVRAHDARRGVKMEDRWGLPQLAAMKRNLTRFLRPDFLETFLSNTEIAAMTAMSAIRVGGK